MAIPFTTAEGAFTRFGKMGNLYLNITGFISNTETNTTATWGTGGVTAHPVGPAIDSIGALYNTTDQQLDDNLYATRNSYRSVHETLLSDITNLASATLIEMANDSDPLTSLDNETAMKNFIADMTAGSYTVKKNTVSVSIANGSANTGNATIVGSLVGPNGVTREYPFAEVIDLLVTSDVGHGGTAGSESLSVLGTPSVATTAWNYPQGSGASTTLTITDPAVDAGQNLLTNSDGNDLTAGIFDDWDTIVGSNATILTGGVSFIPESSTCFKFLGDGSELTAISQTFTDGVLKPNTVYTLWTVSKVSSVPGAGVLAFSLANDSTHAVISDDASTANTLSITLTGSTTSFAVNTAFFRTPKVLPTAGVEMYVRLTTALSNTVGVFFQFALCEATEAYVGGPFLAGFRGSTDVIVNDSFTATVANDYAGKFQCLADRWFDMKSMNRQNALIGYQLPSASSPTVSETLVTA